MIRPCLVLTLGACGGALDLGSDDDYTPPPIDSGVYDVAIIGCSDDSSLEPNDTIAQAFQTPVATQKDTLSLSGLSICPSGDKDHFSITITIANQSLEVLMEDDPLAGDLDASILLSSGAPVANAMPTATGQRRAFIPNLPTGIYYAAVFAPTTSPLTKNNYKLTINVTGP